MRSLLDVVDGTYRAADEDRLLLERSMDIAGEELLQRNRQLEEAQRLARLGSWSLDLDTGAIAWSAEMYRIYGVDPATFKPTMEAVLGLIHPEDRALVQAETRGVSETKPFGASAFRVNRPDGTITRVHGEYRFLADGAGGPVRLVGTNQDVTATWEAAQALREGEARLRESVSLLNATLNSTADGILVVDANGKIVSFNQKFVDLWRIPKAILDARSDDQALAFVLDQLQDPDAFLQKVRYLYVHADEQSFDALAFKDGRTFERFSQPQRLQGRTVGRVWSFRDVTESRRIQAERDAGRERASELEGLREMDRFKTQLLNTASHELNTPLAALTLQLYVLKSSTEGRLGHAGEKAMALLDRNVKRMGALIAATLDVSRIQSGALTLNRAPLTLAQVAREVVEELAPVGAETGVAVRLTVHHDGSVLADHARLTQVLFNFLSNAIKYAPRGGEIVVATEERQDRAVCEVRGPGVGLLPEQQERLFQPFSQVQAGPDQRGGTGLGLFISKSIVEQHGGRVWCESGGRGKGATFGLDLPRAAVDGRSGPAERPGPGAPVVHADTTSTGPPADDQVTRPTARIT